MVNKKMSKFENFFQNSTQTRPGQRKNLYEACKIKVFANDAKNHVKDYNAISSYNCTSRMTESKMKNGNAFLIIFHHVLA